MRFLRMSGRYVQSAVGEYRNPDARIVTLVCCLHTAPAWYYARIRTLLSGLQYAGSVVHSEGAPLLPTPDHTVDEGRVLDKMRHYRDMERRLLAQRGWVDRYDALTGDQWQIRDLSLLEVIRRAGVSACERYVDRLVATYTDAVHSRGAAAVYWRMADDILRTAGSLDTPRESTGGLHDVLVGHRGRVALDGVQSTDRDLVLVWGPAQMPALHAGLGRLGFTLIRAPGWLTAARLTEASPTMTPTAPATHGSP